MKDIDRRAHDLSVCLGYYFMPGPAFAVLAPPGHGADRLVAMDRFFIFSAAKRR